MYVQVILFLIKKKTLTSANTLVGDRDGSLAFAIPPA